jgi:hypothetical protein
MNWNKYGHIFSPNAQYAWNQSHAQVPVVDMVNDEVWRIYYASRDLANVSQTSFIEVSAGRPENILYEHDQPILALGKLGAFDEHGIMPSCIVSRGDKKYLYYIGWSLKRSVPYQNSIGLAISTDGGRTFEKYSDGPLLSINVVDPYFVGTIFVFPEGDLFHGYYLSCTEWKIVDGRPESLYVLKYASSSDGINWQRENRVVIPLKSESEGGLVSASVVKQNGTYRMWFAYRNYFDFRSNPKNSYRIGYAESQDALNWTRDDIRSKIDASVDGWDSDMVSYPYVILYRNKYYMFYNGNGFGRTGFGYATLNRQAT